MPESNEKEHHCSSVLAAKDVGGRSVSMCAVNFPSNTIHPLCPKYYWQSTFWNSVLWTLTRLVCQWLWMFFPCFLASLASSHQFYFHSSWSKLISLGISFILMGIPMQILNLHLLPWYVYLFFIGHHHLNPIWINIYNHHFSIPLTKINNSSVLILHSSQTMQCFI